MPPRHSIERPKASTPRRHRRGRARNALRTASGSVLGPIIGIPRLVCRPLQLCPRQGHRQELRRRAAIVGVGHQQQFEGLAVSHDRDPLGLAGQIDPLQQDQFAFDAYHADGRARTASIGITVRGVLGCGAEHPCARRQAGSVGEAQWDPINLAQLENAYGPGCWRRADVSNPALDLMPSESDAGIDS